MNILPILFLVGALSIPTGESAVKISLKIVWRIFSEDILSVK
jgi:hypothetical protein